MRLDDYQILFDLPEGEYDPSVIQGIRTRTIRAGETLEVECYPIVKRAAGLGRAVKQRKSSPAQAIVNQRNRARRMARLIDQNFTREDCVFTGTHDYPTGDPGQMNIEDTLTEWMARGLPTDIEAARRDYVNFIARLKRRVKAAGEDPRELRHIYVIEEGKDLQNGLPPRYHVHAVIHAPGLTREQIEDAWSEKHGAARANRLDLEHNGGSQRLSNYLNKQTRCRRAWGHSRNLKPPKVTESDRRVSRRRAALVASDLRHSGVEIMERLWPGYRCPELPEVRYSDIVPGAYIYVRMRRRQ